MPRPDYSLVRDHSSELGESLLNKFGDAERARVEVEQRWLDDLRQYRGQYTEAELKAMGDSRSRTYIKSTRLKVEAMTRMMLQMSLGVDDKSWTLEPSPNPEVSAEEEQGLIDRILEAKPDAGPEDFEKAVRSLAAVRARNMEREIQDQLDGGEANRKWSNLLRAAYRNANIYGTGCLKGPLVEERKATSWKQVQAIDPQTGQLTNKWMAQARMQLMPYVVSCDVWSLYPDPSAIHRSELQYIYERHIYTKPDLLALTKHPGFDAEKIREFVRSYPDGNAGTWKEHETQLQSMSTDAQSTPKRERRYEVLEFWGLIEAKQLQDCGCEIAPDDEDQDVWANVWLLGPCVIKAAVKPIKDVTIPYYFCYFDKDETSFWGNGISVLTRDTATAINACIRSALDNAALTSGPQIEVNLDLINSGEDVEGVYPNKVWVRGGDGQMVDPSAPALRVYEIPHNLGQVMPLLQTFERLNDEISGVPSSDVGDISRLGKDQTATEASIRTQRSNTMIREQLLRANDDMVAPLIQALYAWNMQFNERADIKGDYQVKVRGVDGTQSKEMRAQQMVQFWAMAAQDPELRSGIKIPDLLSTIARNMEIPDSVLRSAEDMQGYQQQMMEQQAMMQGQMVMQQLQPILQQITQMLQQHEQALQQIGSEIGSITADQRPEIMLKAKAMEQEFSLKTAKLQEEVALEREKTAAQIELKRAEVEANLQLKREAEAVKLQASQEERAKREQETMAKKESEARERERPEPAPAPPPPPQVIVVPTPSGGQKRIKLERNNGQLVGATVVEEE